MQNIELKMTCFLKMIFLSSYNKEIQQQKTKPENSNEVCFFLYPIFYTYPELGNLNNMIQEDFFKPRKEMNLQSASHS